MFLARASCFSFWGWSSYFTINTLVHFLTLGLQKYNLGGNKNILNEILDTFMIYNIKRLLETEEQSGTIYIIGLLIYTNRIHTNRIC